MRRVLIVALTAAVLAGPVADAEPGGRLRPAHRPARQPLN
jgi:hypothetical protein